MKLGSGLLHLTFLVLLLMVFLTVLLFGKPEVSIDRGEYYN